MATERELLAADNGVELSELRLRHDSVAVDRIYLLETLRSPEKRHFKLRAEADQAFADEVELCRNDAFVRQRLNP